MNILFAAGYLARYPFANNNIEIALADCLAKMGHTCHICGFSTDLCGQETRETSVVLSRNNPYPLFERALRRLEHYVQADTTGADRAALAKKFALRHPLDTALVVLARKDLFYKNEPKQYGKFITRYAKKHQMDVVLCFAYPFPRAQGVTSSACTLPMLYSQFDPHGLHEYLPDETKAERIALECGIIERAGYTITTHALLAQYQAHPSYQPLCHKMRALEFPTFGEKEIAHVAPAFDFDKNNINVLYCGTIDDDFRNPAYFLDACIPLFARMPQLRLYFLGNIISQTLPRYAAQYPEQIIVHSIVENDVASKTVAAADVLLNLGNAITNMMPSKIFDCFATGKPILNVQKIAQCPAAPYFAQYPMQLTLHEYASQPATELLAAFLAENSKKQLPFADILPLYETATPQFVANELEHMIKELQA